LNKATTFATEDSFSADRMRSSLSLKGDGRVPQLKNLGSKGSRFIQDSLKSKSKRSLQNWSRRPKMIRAKTGLELKKKQIPGPFSVQEMELDKFSELKEVEDAVYDILYSQGLPSSHTEGSFGPRMFRAGGRVLTGMQKATSTTSYHTNISELVLQPNISSNLDTNVSFTWMDTRRTSKCLDNERNSWPSGGPEFPMSVMSKKTGRSDPANTLLHLCLPEKTIGSASENEDSQSISEGAAGAGSEVEVGAQEDANQSSNISSLRITSPSTMPFVSSSEFSSAPRFFSAQARFQRLISPKISEVSTVYDEPVPGLQEKLIAAALVGNLEMVCGLCNQGATDYEIAVAFTVAKAKGFNEIADELMFGYVRLEWLTQRFTKISLAIGPPVSKICYDNWRIIAEMCTTIAPPPPLSTRKGQVFFPAS